MENNLTYISLFSSAGVGCFGFKKEGYNCIATNELLEKRMKIQRINNKCKYQTGYIVGDIRKDEIKEKIYNEIKIWNDKVDVIIATPPCQGMSVANLKKNKNDIYRNSLIVETIEIIKEIKPKFFLFENVSSFWKTNCFYKENIKKIGETILEILSNEYEIEYKILNFKNYGANSSRKRILVIGKRKEIKNIDIEKLFPKYRKEKTLYEIIGNMKSLEWGEIDPEDFFHNFRVYDKKMLDWIKDLKEGESAFDNKDDSLKPHKIINGEIVINKKKNSGKYERQCWNKVAKCVLTRNDILSSQSTIHPKDNRVFSIRELMKMMSIPDDFKWLEFELETLNNLNLEEKKKILKTNELNIRQSIGEAVPTEIFRQIAENIKKYYKND